MRPDGIPGPVLLPICRYGDHQPQEERKEPPRDSAAGAAAAAMLDTAVTAEDKGVAIQEDAMIDVGCALTACMLLPGRKAPRYKLDNTMSHR